MKTVLVFIIVLFVAAFFAVTGATSIDDPRPKTCPDGGEWVKVNSGDLSQYPVEGAVEYCFKAGSWDTIDYIPEGGFGQEGSCSEGIQYCGLSHWAYRLDDATPTPSDTPTDTNTPEPSPTFTQTPESTATFTQTPTNTSPVTDTPTPTPTDTPHPTITPTKDKPCTETSCGRG